MAPKIESVNLLSELPFCEVRHRGLAIDMGSSWANAHRSFEVGPFDAVKLVRRAGHTSGAVHTRRLNYDFWLDRTVEDVELAFRVQAERASRMTVYVDDLRLGQARLKRDASHVVTFGPVKKELSPGRHVIGVRFVRGRGSPDDPLALLDWARVYLPDNFEGEYAAPTRANVLQDVELSGQPRRSIALRSPSSVRCGLQPSEGTRVQLDVGYWGDGEGTVAVKAHLGHQRTVTLAERKVKGGEDARWAHLDLTFDALGSELMVLELAAVESTGTGRAVFGEPRLVRTLAEVAEVEARNVVVVVASGLGHDLIPPWGDRKGLSQLYDLTEEGVAFEGYRVASTLVGGVMATLLTGEPGSRHTLTHTGAELPERFPLLSRAMRQVGGRSAMFTGVPYTFGAFGFDRDWSQYESISPVRDFGGEEPLVRAAKWLETELDEDEETQKLLVVHVRGAHPPWDLTKEQAKELPPAEYNGILEPRRGAILLRKVRDRNRASRRKLGPRDWEHLVAMQRAALIKQDAALGDLIETLKTHEQWDDTLFIYMGDVARGVAPRVPFHPHGELREDRLSPPLIVKLPRSASKGTRVKTPLGTLDVSRALFAALGLEFPGEESLIGLAELGGGVVPLHAQGILAVAPPDFAFTLDRWRLSGPIGATPALCDREVDPVCHQDLYAESPFLMEWLWRAAFRAFQRQGMLALEAEAVMADLDEDTQAALTVFGL